MHRNQSRISAGGTVVFLLVVVNTVVLEQGFINDPRWYEAFPYTLPLLLITVFINRNSAGQ